MGRSSKIRWRWVGFGIVVALVLGAGGASAGPTEAERRADALFDEGRALVDAGKFAEACPKFEESQRLDPGLGTLLNLAACYEQVGRLASALTAFRSAEEQARAAGAGEKKREQTAAERARALEARVTRLTITLAPGDRPAGFVVTRDGVTLTALDFGRRIAVDPGTVVVAATAPGYAPFHTEIAIGRDGGARAVDVPELVLERRPDPGSGGSGGGPGRGSDAPGAELGSGGAPGGDGGGDTSGNAGGGDLRRSPRQTYGLISAAVGVAALGTGVALGLSAKGQYDDVACTAGDGAPTGCSAAENDAIARARSRGNVGTLVGGLGVAAVAAGAVLWLTAPAPHAVQVAPLVTTRALGVAVGGRF